MPQKQSVIITWLVRRVSKKSQNDNYYCTSAPLIFLQIKKIEPPYSTWIIRCALSVCRWCLHTHQCFRVISLVICSSGTGRPSPTHGWKSPSCYKYNCATGSNHTFSFLQKNHTKPIKIFASALTEIGAHLKHNLVHNFVHLKKFAKKLYVISFVT